MNYGQTRLSYLAMMTGIMRQTLTARMHALFEKDQIKRSSGNNIILDASQAYKLIEDQFILKKGKIIYIGMPKGGVGKSFVSFFVTAMACSLGLKVCAIDLDPGNHFTRQLLNLGQEEEDELPINTPVFVDIINNHKHPELAKKITIQDAIMNISDNFSLIPSTSKNALIPQIISSQGPKHLENWVNGLCLDYLRENYDIIIIDSCGALNTLLSSIYICLDKRDNALIPANADQSSLSYLRTIMSDIYEIRKEYRKDSEINVNILINKRSHNRVSQDEFATKIRKEYGDFVLEEHIPDSAQLSEVYNKPELLTSLKDPKQFYNYLNFLLKRLEIIKGNN